MRFLARDEEDYSLHLTSLIDVVFLLLIFFMVSTSFIDFFRRSCFKLYYVCNCPTVSIIEFNSFVDRFFKLSGICGWKQDT